jgi:membrane associated rhomboid family serine protease
MTPPKNPFSGGGPGQSPEPESRGIFNRVSPVILVLILLMASVQIYLIMIGNPDSQRALIVQLSFIPARFSDANLIIALEGLRVPAAATVFSYFMVNLSLTEFGFSAVMLLIFGTPVAIRFGMLRFLLLAIGSTVAAAVFYFYMSPDSMRPMIGASAIINACVACFSRFGFETGGAMSDIRIQYPLSCFIKARPLERMLSNRKLVIFGSIWIFLTIILPVAQAENLSATAAPLWHPRVAGFLVGLLLFDLIDPVKSGGIDPVSIEKQIADAQAGRGRTTVAPASPEDPVAENDVEAHDPPTPTPTPPKKAGGSRPPSVRKQDTED